MSQLTHPDHDLLLYVFHDVIPGLWVLRRGVRDEVLQVAGLDVRGHAAGVDAVLGDQSGSDHTSAKIYSIELVQ